MGSGQSEAQTYQAENRKMKKHFGSSRIQDSLEPAAPWEHFSPTVVDERVNEHLARLEAMQRGGCDNLIEGADVTTSCNVPTHRTDSQARELALAKFPDKSQQEIADHVGCSQQYVALVKKDITTACNTPTRKDKSGREPVNENSCDCSSEHIPTLDDAVMVNAPVILTRFDVATSLQVPKGRIYAAASRGIIRPDFFSFKGDPLFAANSLPKIAKAIGGGRVAA